MPELEIIMKKYPNAILTLNSAFYYYGLTDTIPDHYYVATPKSNRKIEDVRVKLSFDLYNLDSRINMTRLVPQLRVLHKSQPA